MSVATRRAQATWGDGGRTPAWRGDHEWSPDGERIGQSVLWGLVWHVMLPLLLGAPLLFIGSASFRTAIVIGLAVGLVRGLYQALAGGTFGTVRVLYLEAPYRPQGSLTVRVGKLDGGAWQKGVDFTLRCVETQGPRWGRLKQLWSGAVGEEITLHEESVFLRAADLPLPGSDIDLSFDLPPGLPGTSLSADLPCRWELHMTCPRAVSDDGHTFLLPVYADDGPAPDGEPKPRGHPQLSNETHRLRPSD